MGFRRGRGTCSLGRSARYSCTKSTTTTGARGGSDFDASCVQGRGRLRGVSAALAQPHCRLRVDITGRVEACWPRPHLEVVDVHFVRRRPKCRPALDHDIARRWPLKVPMSKKLERKRRGFRRGIKSSMFGASTAGLGRNSLRSAALASSRKFEPVALIFAQLQVVSSHFGADRHPALPSATAPRPMPTKSLHRRSQRP